MNDTNAKTYFDFTGIVPLLPTVKLTKSLSTPTQLPLLPTVTVTK